MPPDDQGIGQRQFMIKYDLKERDYFVKDLGEGSGTFVKVDQDLVSQNYLRN